MKMYENFFFQYSYFLQNMDENFEDAAENQLLHSSRNGEINVVKQLLERRKNGEIQLDIDCKGIQNDSVDLCYLCRAIATQVKENVCPKFCT